jgi:hypothetical protein
VWPRQYRRRESDRPAVRPVRSQSNQQSGHTSKSTGKRAWRGHSAVSPAWLPANQAGVSPRRLGYGKRDPDVPDTAPRVWRATGRGGQAIGCWNWSAAAVARRALPAHRPGRLPGAFRACALGNLVLKRASRLDAFSAYPFPTWLPGDAPSGTAGTPEVGPPQSSRTRGDPSQVSYAHGR